ncbi:ankyrin repeat domain-containing protein [Paenibacillus algorifonticola]|uniref:ankyrin repeat domain-containing protein n=1 Tax=Paenibacillus algorifonticola TaxID=684063 RepID=UPI003D27E7A6
MGTKWDERMVQACKSGNMAVIKTLISEGMDLNDSKNPAIVTASKQGKRIIFEFLLEQGADINAVNHVGSSALSHAVAWENAKAVEALLALGIDVALHGGLALRGAASGRLDLVKMLVEAGAPINFNEPDMVRPYGGTPLQVAAGIGHLPIVRYLLEAGADPAIKDSYGERAFTDAKRYKHKEVMELIYSYEPKELHDFDNQAAKLKKAGLPAVLIRDLGETSSRVEIPDCEQVSYIEFGSVLDVSELEYQGLKLLNLLVDMDNYSALGMFVWVPAYKKFASYDVEHQELMLLPDATWAKLRKKPGAFIDRILDGEYEPLALADSET